MAGFTVCPPSARACAMSESGHSCCAGKSSFRAPSCCQDGAPSTSLASGIKSPLEHHHGLTPLLPAAVANVDCDHDALTLLWARQLRLHDGLPPPDTLVTRHTSLLL